MVLQAQFTDVTLRTVSQFLFKDYPEIYWECSYLTKENFQTNDNPGVETMPTQPNGKLIRF